jgi:hypothetical protein
MNILNRVFRSSVAVAVGVAAFIATASAFAAVNAITPSTNDINRTNGWAYVDQLAVGPGYVTLQFVSTRGFWSCFEVRADGDTSQVLTENGGANYNTNVTDGLYPYYCENNSTETQTFFADQYVEVRMVFGAETDERFDWTSFDVLPSDPSSKEDCKNGGWMTYGFKNQGQCVRFVETQKDSR